MEKIAQAVTLGAAACVVGSAVLMYGQFFGLRHPELIWYVTFTDIVNHAAPTFLVYGLTLLFQIYWQHSISNSNSRWRWLGILFLFAPAALVVYLEWDHQTQMISLIGFFSVINLTTIFQDELIKWGGKTTYTVVDGALWGLYVLMLVGYFFGHSARVSENGLKITSAGKTECAVASYPLDRGLVLLRDERVELVPWGNITTMTTVKVVGRSGPRPDQKPDSCFGMI